MYVRERVGFALAHMSELTQKENIRKRRRSVDEDERNKSVENLISSSSSSESESVESTSPNKNGQQRGAESATKAHSIELSDDTASSSSSDSDKKILTKPARKKDMQNAPKSNSSKEPRPIEQIDASTMQLVRTHASVSEASRSTDISRTTLRRACQAGDRIIDGYLYRYAPDQQAGNVVDQQTSCPSKSQAPTYDLSAVKVGQRVAMEFGQKIKFGEVEICMMEEDSWHVGLDDGETYELNGDEMSKALSTYDRCRREEMSYPNRLTKIAAITAAFEIKRQHILAKLPEEYKAQSLDIGFARWKGSYQPVLFLGPYDVSEGPLRKKFVQEIKKAEGNMERLPRLVYWYGVDNLQEAFAFVSKQDCLTYKEGSARGISEIPSKLKAKLDAGKKLSKKEAALVTAWTHMKEDLPKQKKDRVRFSVIKEDHKWIMDGERLIIEIEAEREYDLFSWGI